MIVQSLNGSWDFLQAFTPLWQKGEIPGSVQCDLLRHRRIPDPFYEDNENRVQWVALTQPPGYDVVVVQIRPHLQKI